MNSLKIEKERIAMSILTAVWLTLSVLAAPLYLGFQKTESRERNLVRYEKIELRIKASSSLSDDQIVALYKEVDAQKKRENFLTRLIVMIFEALSLSLLLLIRNRKKVFRLLQKDDTQRKIHTTTSLKE